MSTLLWKTPENSHTGSLMEVSKAIMIKEKVKIDEIRLIDHEVASGVYPDMTEHGWKTDEWPSLFKRIIEANILIVGTPIWPSEKSSAAQKLIERLYAMNGKMNNKGQSIFYGKVGGCIITRNENGVKHCAMGILYSLQYVGYYVPPQATSGWLGEVGQGPSYGDQEWKGERLKTPISFESDFTNRNTTFITYNLLYLASVLRTNNDYPSYGNSRKEWDDGKRWEFENPEYR
jgi:multimeric flavodoxin WrbA